MRRVRLLLQVLLSVMPVMAGCMNPAGPGLSGGSGHEGQATGDVDAREELHARAAALWQARQERDWGVLYDFESPERRAQLSREDYIPWIEQNYPFRIQDFRVSRVTRSNDMGWVDVTYRASLARFPDMPPRETDITEKWYRDEGRWYPVPAELVSLYPLSPAVRDAEQEALLRERFELSWQRRQAGDVEGLYAMIDPADRVLVDRESFEEGESLHRYIECEVHWVEVVGDRGRVNVSITYRLNDPSLTKLPPHLTRVTERWVRRSGQWYRDLARDPHEGETNDDDE